jgi:hypothetical protein
MNSIQVFGRQVTLMLRVFLLSLMTVVTVFAQENTGSIQGAVKDTTGAAIAGARVTASSPALVRPLEVISDNEGAYRFPKLPVGQYTITVSQNGFKTSKNQDIYVVLGKELTLDVALNTGEVTESVTISASSEAIDITSSKSATNITEKFIDTTPKGRTFNSLLQAAPGVIYDTQAGSAPSMSQTVGPTGTAGSRPGGGVGGYSASGASGSENQFIIDGVEVSNIRNAALGRESAIPFEFIREVQVKSGGFEAEYGGAVGAVVNVVTKSGTNEYHGEGALLFTGSKLNSNVRGSWILNPSNNAVADFFRQKEDDYNSFYTGFSLGGPIIKERLHFFSSYFPEFNRGERSINYEDGPQTSTSRVTRHYAINRLDYAPTQKIQFNTSYIWTPIRVKGLLRGADPRIGRPSNDLAALGGFTPSQAFTTSLTYTLTPSLIVSARYGYKYTNDKGNTYGLPPNPWIRYETATSGDAYIGPDVPDEFDGDDGFQNVSDPFLLAGDQLKRHNVYLDGTYIRRISGQQHSFKGGFALNRISNLVRGDYPNGRFDIFWGDTFNRGSLAVNRRGTYGYYTWQDGIRYNNGANSRNMGFYAQDQWQIHRSVTLNLGMRLENEFLPPFTKTAANGAPIPNPIRFGWSDKIAPRLGFAWDVLGNAKWKLSASYGHYYDTLKYELARGAFGGDIWFSSVYELNDPNVNALNKANPGALGPLIINFNNRTIPINAQGELDGIDPSVHATYSRSFSVASEHQLWGNMVGSVRYTRNRLQYPIEDIGVFDDQESEVYVIGNPGYGLRSAITALNGQEITLKPGQQLFPVAARNYDGMEFRLDGRLSGNRFRGLSYNLSYTYSRLWGNYAGLANSDEAGRSQPNVSRAFDLPYGNFDSQGNNVYGFLNTDRPHAFKLFGNYELGWRGGATSFSGGQYIFSGTPRSTEVLAVVPVFINGRNDMGRTPTFTQSDLLVAHTFKLSERTSLKLDANIINLFNQATPTTYTVRLNRNGNITVGAPGGDAIMTDQQFFNGFDAMSLINDPGAANLARNPIYGLPLSYQGNREIRLGLHFIF